MSGTSAISLDSSSRQELGDHLDGLFSLDITDWGESLIDFF